ncbi:MAG: hypothetical protein MJZ34_05280 [Paludibacteraceae bacterium]|nr:hypothetical protein [Paludibacteraceae bacterium]
MNVDESVEIERAKKLVVFEKEKIFLALGVTGEYEGLNKCGLFFNTTKFGTIAFHIKDWIVTTRNGEECVGFSVCTYEFYEPNTPRFIRKFKYGSVKNISKLVLKYYGIK